MRRALTYDDAEMIRMFAESGISVPALAKEYNVDPNTIANIIKGKSYRTPDVVVSPRCDRSLSDDQVMAIKLLQRIGRRAGIIAYAIGSNRSIVEQVMRGITYKEIECPGTCGSSSEPSEASS